MSAQKVKWAPKGDSLIPLMNATTDPMSKNWNQTSPSLFFVGREYIFITKAVFDQMPEYSCSDPTGVYPGKMWVSCPEMYNHMYPTPLRGWFLCWFIEAPYNPAKCIRISRPVHVI
jgi:hypothetical protein